MLSVCYVSTVMSARNYQPQVEIRSHIKFHYNKSTPTKMSTNPQQSINKATSDDHFEELHLEPAPPKPQPLQPQPEQQKKQPPSQPMPSTLVQSKANLIQDELLKEDSINLCTKCCKCVELEEKLALCEEDKETLQDNLTQITIELAELKREEKRRKEETVDKGQLNYVVQSLREVIKSFEDEKTKTYKFITQTMKIPQKQPKQKQVFKLVENIITDFISNWHEIDRQLTQLVAISSPTGESSSPKQDKFVYNYYEISAKLDKVRENVVELQKRLKY